MTNSPIVLWYMLRILSLLVLFPVIFLTMGHAEETANNIEVTAKTLSGTKTTVTGSDGVVVYYNDTVIKADRAMYDRETQLLTLDGKVEMIGYHGSKEHTSHMEIHTQSNEVKFNELFLVSKNDVWLYTESAHRQEGNYTFGRSILSSCDANDPLWKMASERSLYDSEAEYMKIYNAKVYFMDVPVLYSPYMAFSTNNKRSSGLLFPLFGISSQEGFVYEQPIFWAISDSMDLEVNPQIRTRRGYGIYGTYRFVDTDHSKGALRIGYFKDKAQYVSDNNLPEDIHYGAEFNYESTKLLSDTFSFVQSDGLYINSTFLNDIDYLNLQKTSLTHFGLTPLQESRLNYYIQNNDYYGGINAKYFVDTRKVSNDDTLQILPSVQLHKYLDALFVQNLTYSADLTVNNFHRQQGSTLKQIEMKVPFEYTTSFFDDFVNLSLGEELFYSKNYFGNGEYPEDSFQYYNSGAKVKLFTDLTKKYDSFTHVLQPSLKYYRPGSESQRPIPFEMLTEEQKELFVVGLPEENYLLSVGHYFYDDAMKLKFYQRFSQNYYVNRNYHLADFSNEMQYNWKKWQFYNNTVYANEFKELREVSSRITLNESMYHFTLGHTFKQELPDQTSIIPANDLNFNFGYQYNKNISFNGALTYNIDDELSKQWSFGGAYKQDCWSMIASVRREITPRPTGETLDDTFFIQFNFIPFLTVGSN